MCAHSRDGGTLPERGPGVASAVEAIAVAGSIPAVGTAFAAFCHAANTCWPYPVGKAGQHRVMAERGGGESRPARRCERPLALPVRFRSHPQQWRVSRSSDRPVLYLSRFLAVCCIAREASLLCAHIAETAAHYQSAASFIDATPPYRHRIGALT